MRSPDALNPKHRLLHTDGHRHRDLLNLAGLQDRLQADDRVLLGIGIGRGDGVHRGHHQGAFRLAGPIRNGLGIAAKLGGDRLPFARNLARAGKERLRDGNDAHRQKDAQS